jgi:murein endopeptidase
VGTERIQYLQKASVQARESGLRGLLLGEVMRSGGPGLRCIGAIFFKKKSWATSIKKAGQP